MKIKRYLVVGWRPRSKPSTRLTVQPPALESHEVAVQLNLEVPEELFRKPRLEASITIPAEGITPPPINAEVIDNIREIISKEIGVDLSVALVEPTNDQQPL